MGSKVLGSLQHCQAGPPPPPSAGTSGSLSISGEAQTGKARSPGKPLWGIRLFIAFNSRRPPPQSMNTCPQACRAGAVHRLVCLPGIQSPPLHP